MPAVLRQRPARLLSLVGACLLLCGCGAVREAPLSLTTAAKPAGFLPFGYCDDGFALLSPGTWNVETLPAPGVVSISSGPAVIAVWHYVRNGPALTGTASLRSAEDALISSAKAADPSLRVLRSSLSTVSQPGASVRVGAVILDGIERIKGQTRRVRSEHVYSAGAEIVLDEYAPVADFGIVDHSVFSPVRKSLALCPAGKAT